MDCVSDPVGGAARDAVGERRRRRGALEPPRAVEQHAPELAVRERVGDEERELRVALSEHDGPERREHRAVLVHARRVHAEGAREPRARHVDAPAAQQAQRRGVRRDGAQRELDVRREETVRRRERGEARARARHGEPALDRDGRERAQRRGRRLPFPRDLRACLARLLREELRDDAQNALPDCFHVVPEKKADRNLETSWVGFPFSALFISRLPK